MKKLSRLFAVLSGMFMLLFAASAFAEPTTATPDAVTAAAASSKAIGIAIAAAFAVGIAALGGTISQGKAAATALEGIARNPGAASKVQVPMIIGMALIESLVILAWVIAYTLVGKIS